MSRSGVIILFGILTILTPFSGLPSAFRTFLFVVFGAVIVVAGLMERLERVRAARAQATLSTTEAPVLRKAPEAPLNETPHGVSPI